MADGEEHFVRRRMYIGVRQVPEHCRPLLREALATRFERLSQEYVAGCRIHRHVLIEIIREFLRYTGSGTGVNWSVMRNNQSELWSRAPGR